MISGRVPKKKKIFKSPSLDSCVHFNSCLNGSSGAWASPSVVVSTSRQDTSEALAQNHRKRADLMQSMKIAPQCSYLVFARIYWGFLRQLHDGIVIALVHGCRGQDTQRTREPGREARRRH